MDFTESEWHTWVTEHEHREYSHQHKGVSYYHLYFTCPVCGEETQHGPAYGDYEEKEYVETLADGHEIRVRAARETVM